MISTIFTKKLNSDKNKKVLYLISCDCSFILRHSEGSQHGLVNYIDTKAKCRHLKKLTCKGTLQVFIRVYKLLIHSVMLAFSTQLCELLPL